MQQAAKMLAEIAEKTDYLSRRKTHYSGHEDCSDADKAIFEHENCVSKNGDLFLMKDGSAVEKVDHAYISLSKSKVNKIVQ